MTAALSGTPGVGKTTVANILRGRGYSVLDLNISIHKGGLTGEKDEQRDTYEVDISMIKQKFFDLFKKYDIVEGHLTHHLGLSPVIILRCSPQELGRRMISKRWSKKKVEENLLAEILDVILLEALEMEVKDIYEIDTTDKVPVEIGNDIQNILNGNTEKYAYGKIDWSEHLE